MLKVYTLSFCRQCSLYGRLSVAVRVRVNSLFVNLFIVGDDDEDAVVITAVLLLLLLLMLLISLVIFSRLSIVVVVRRYLVSDYSCILPVIATSATGICVSVIVHYQRTTFVNQFRTSRQKQNSRKSLSC